MDYYTLLKMAHIFLVVSWFAGLFYLPRIFVNLAMNDPASKEYEVLVGMSARLLKFMTPIGVGALVMGLGVVIVAFRGMEGVYWIHAKYLIGLLLAVYHFMCWRYHKAFKERRNRRSHKFFRIFNELPVFLLIAAIYLATAHPF